MDDFAQLYASTTETNAEARYQARCHCGTVRYFVTADPVDAKICHCGACQTLHGAPMQWAAIFHKHHVRFTAGISQLRFFNAGLNTAERILPCKVSCRVCGAPVADEGRNMWLAFPSLFDFGTPPIVPEMFKPTCHIFYTHRVFGMNDGLPKWSGLNGTSDRLE